jgi:hypothetical protein
MRIRAFKHGTSSGFVRGSYAADALSAFLRFLLRLGYGTARSANPSTLHSGHRFAAIVMLLFLFAYWLSGFGTFRELNNLQQWGNGEAPNSVLNYLLLVLIFWNCLLAGLTFFVDHFRFPALAALGIGLFAITFLGSSDRFLRRNRADAR